MYEYVQDMPGALGEAFRVLRPGGRLLVIVTDWGSLVWHSRDAERMGAWTPPGKSTSSIPISPGG